LNAVTSACRELSITGGLYATLATTHVGPLVENPVRASAASVPSAEARFCVNPAPSFSSMLARAGAKSGTTLAI
jgi:hypothetical protein